jgi:hypothetical protein
MNKDLLNEQWEQNVREKIKQNPAWGYKHFMGEYNSCKWKMRRYVTAAILNAIFLCLFMPVCVLKAFDLQIDYDYLIWIILIIYGGWIIYRIYKNDRTEQDIKEWKKTCHQFICYAESERRQRSEKKPRIH